MKAENGTLRRFEMKKRYLGLLIIIGIGFGVITFINKKTYLLEDDVIGVYINNELYTDIPSKDSALFQKAACDDENVSATWDSESWGLLLKNLTKKTKCNLYFYQGDTVFNFDYTGAEQTFTAPVSGTYKLETWGGQGEGWPDYIGSTIKGGVGGYASGNVTLTKESTIYVNVGRENENGSNGQRGGGSTHISLKTGTLLSLENYKESILLVSGGGGGSEWKDCPGGSGGGFKGNDGKSGSAISANGGSQIAGGKSSALYSASGSTAIYNGSFGQGGYTIGGDGGGQGGNGYFGGGASDYGNGGGGGSGYIGNPLLKDKVMYCYDCEESNEESTKTISTTCSEETPTENCAKKGNGYARITLVSIDE